MQSIVNAALEHERESATKAKAGEELRAKLASQGFMETGAKHHTSSTIPSIPTIEKMRALNTDIRKAVAEGNTNEVNALTNKRKRLYAE
jgi:hypothetical protein